MFLSFFCCKVSGISVHNLRIKIYECAHGLYLYYLEVLLLISLHILVLAFFLVSELFHF